MKMESRLFSAIVKVEKTIEVDIELDVNPEHIDWQVVKDGLWDQYLKEFGNIIDFQEEMMDLEVHPTRGVLL